MGIGRDRILAALEAGLRPDPSVHALWLEGSLANGRADELSDIDLWLDVDDERVGEALARCEAILGRLGPLDRSYERPHPHPLIRQRFFKHAQRDLPPDVAARLADLYRLTSIEDIAARVPLAAALFEETLAALDAPA